MERNEQIAFGFLATLILIQRSQLLKMMKKQRLIEKNVDTLIKFAKTQLQKDIDQEFAQIIKNYYK